VKDFSWFSFVAGFLTAPTLGAIVCVAVWRYDLWRASRVERES